MKQFIFLLLLLLGAIPLCCPAQEVNTNTFRHAFKLQVGSPLHGFNQEIKASTPVIAVQYERRIHKIGIAAMLALTQFKGYEENHNGTLYYILPTTGELQIFGIRGNYYFLDRGKFDIYGGIMASYLVAEVGVYLETKSVNTTFRKGTVGEKQAYKFGGFKPGLQLGGHYWFSRLFGVWGEVSYGTALFNLGVALRK